MQRTTRFEYLRCPNGHGRLTSFFNFLREKDFIRPLTPQQIAHLRENLQSVNCSNCGAPVDLSKGATCEHCRSPLSMLDMRQAETLVAQLQQADNREKQGVDPALPLAEAIEAFRKRYISEVLERNGGNRTKAAKDLDVDPRTVFRHLEKLEAERRGAPTEPAGGGTE